MKARDKSQWQKTWMIFGAITTLILSSMAPSDQALALDQDSEKVGGMTGDEALRLGERIYREGILPSGKTLKGMVKGDIPVEGTMFTCVSCHLRSGFGTNEGKIRTPPIDGLRLYSPVSLFRGVPLIDQNSGKIPPEDNFRPAYTDETLATAMEIGVDSAGRQMNSAMPMYSLSKSDMNILVHYLKNLSVNLEPGVSETSLHFSTVISDDVAAADRESMVTSLTSFIQNWRVPTTRLERTIKTVSHRKEGQARDLRTLSLSVWDLKGLPETWKEQLENYYRRDPVFAMIGGMSNKDWAPIHQFCEQNRIPNIFPLTNFPTLSKRDWYTLYLSQGLAQEGKTAAQYLNKSNKDKRQTVIQVFRDTLAGRTLAKAFEDSWTGLGNAPPENKTLNDQERLAPDYIENIASSEKTITLVLWLAGDDFLSLSPLADQRERVSVIASATQLGRELYKVPEDVRPLLSLTYPYSLPKESVGFRSQVDQTLSTEQLPAVQREPALKLYSVYQVLSGPLSKLRSFVHRDYFMELLESAPDLAVTPVLYPRLTFGQGQRYAAKGCYIVGLSVGKKPELVKKTEWIFY